MEVLASVLGALLLAVTAIAGLLWRKYSAAKRSADEWAVAGPAAVASLTTAFNDLQAARAALAKQNDLEASVDAKTVAIAPGIADAIARFNGLQPSAPGGTGTPAAALSAATTAAVAGRGADPMR